MGYPFDRSARASWRRGPPIDSTAVRILATLNANVKAIFLRRSQGKDAGQFVFEKLAAPQDGWKRGSAITKAFGRLRTRLGIGERAEGQRQASKTFTALRIWHASKRRDALNAGAQGFTMYTLADNLGQAGVEHDEPLRGQGVSGGQEQGSGEREVARGEGGR
jgi:hypothetical protein